MLSIEEVRSIDSRRQAVKDEIYHDINSVRYIGMADGRLRRISITDHVDLSSVGTKSHQQIDTHIKLTDEHIALTNEHIALTNEHIALTNEHIDWTDTSENFKTTGNMHLGGTIYPFHYRKDSTGTITAGFWNDNNANTSAHMRLYLRTGGANAGDPKIQFSNQVIDWVIGEDNSDSDAWKVSESSNLGSNDRFIIKTGGEINIPGDLLFVGAGSGLPCGEIYVNDNTTVTSVSNAGFTQFLYFDTNGHANLTTPDHTNDHITITKAGVYVVDCCVNIKNSSGAAHDIEVVIAKNNGSTIFPNMRRHRTLGTGTDVGAIPICGHLGLEINDTIEVWITSDSGAARDVTGEDVVLMATMVGG